MKASLFSPLLILLIIILFAKASMLVGRIQEQTNSSMHTSTTSVLVDTAYAKSPSDVTLETPKQLPDSNTVNNENSNNAPIKKNNEKANTPSSGNNAINNLTRSEINLLKELSKRREKLDNDKKNLTVREQVLKATENKLDQKVIELASLQAQLEGLIKQYDQKENSKIMSLVKIYETMKPKDAAKIFNELDMSVLLKVVSNMKEVKVAPVIASMDPVKARKLSMELAKQKPID